MEQEELGSLKCDICGSEVCCEPAHRAFSLPQTFVCQVCGSLVTVKGRGPSPLLCCGVEMLPFPGGLW